MPEEKPDLNPFGDHRPLTTADLDGIAEYVKEKNKAKSSSSSKPRSRSRSSSSSKSNKGSKS